MADASGPMDMHKVSLCYAKLFQQQAAFAAEQASLFAKIAAGDDEALDAVLKMPDPGKREDAEGGKNGKKRKKRDPNQPKRPKSGYQLFVIERTPSLREEQPNKQMRELMSVLADEWKSLSEAQKTKYQEAAVEEKSKYQEELDAYKASKNGHGGEEAAAAAAADGGAKAEGEETESDGGGSAAAQEHKKKKKHKKKHKHHKKERSE